MKHKDLTEKLKGKKDSVSVFEIYDGDSEQIIERKLKTKADFEEGLQQYFRMEFAKAAVCFENVLKQNSDDKTAKLYLERSAQSWCRVCRRTGKGLRRWKTSNPSPCGFKP